MEIKVVRNILQANEDQAQKNKQFIEQRRAFAINLVSSPGAGKTTLLQRTLGALRNELKMAVLEGDIATQLDAERLAGFDVPVVQINTDGSCHLNAAMVSTALSALDSEVDKLDLLLIENVGNLVCPAEFLLGEDCKVVVLSTTEGDDKPAKYPAMFHESSVLVINKIDLLPYLDFDLAKARSRALAVNPSLRIIELSSRTGEGFDVWLDWLRSSIANKRTTP